MWGMATDSAKQEMVGSFKIRLDDRGRLAVPNSFRAMLKGGDFVLTAHPHDCLSIYSAERFDGIRAQFAERPNLKYFDSHMEELVLGSAEPLQLDSAGRFLINGALRDYAKIDRDVRVFHLPDSMRLWSSERWDQRHALMMAKLQDEDLSSWQNLRL